MGAKDEHFHTMDQQCGPVAPRSLQSITQSLWHSRKDIAIALAVFLLALLLRAIYISQLRSSPLFDEPVMDELYHDQWAQAIADGR